MRATMAAPPSDPIPGQVWRAAWQRTVLILTVLDVAETHVTAIPTSLDVRYHDDTTLLLPKDSSTLQQPLALWYGLREDLPWCVLDRQVAQVAAPLPAQAPTTAASPPPDHQAWGTAIPSPAAPAAEYRAALFDKAADLAEAHWAPRGSGDLSGLLVGHGMTTRILTELLSITPDQALALRRGQTPVTPEQADILAPRLDLTTDGVLDANPALPQELVHELSRPVRRPQLRALASQLRLTEYQVRTGAAFGSYTLAARQDPGAGPAPDWPARVDRYFQLCLQEKRP
ncbi:hypothetical protein WN990_37055 [Kitasatospora purpeofusca]|uniref:hypothetical protein n=1 Tax=Kitasatospora purpeofusca TaxID=67352 RepID=UPI0030F1B14D